MVSVAVVEVYKALLNEEVGSSKWSRNVKFNPCNANDARKENLNR